MVKEEWRHGKKMLYHGTRDVYFMQEKANMMGAGDAIFAWFADMNRISKMLLEKAGISGKLRQDVATCLYGMGIFDVSRGGGSQVGCNIYALELDFQLCGSQLR